MPVQGRGWYKRPYHVLWFEDGVRKERCFHWKASADELWDRLHAEGRTPTYEVVGVATMLRVHR